MNSYGEILGSDFDTIFERLLYFTDIHPHHVCSPRGQKIKERLVQTVILTNPRARLLYNPARKANYAFATAEFLWYWQGRNDVEMLSFYNSRIADSSNDGLTLNSAYGRRIISCTAAQSQWDEVAQVLVDDSDSRRAIMFICDRTDISAIKNGLKDVPCTLSLQFFIRDGALDLHVSMRSNDEFWGLTQDLFSFTLLQECMLLDLRSRGMTNLQLGTYFHTAGSMHIYERHFGLTRECLSQYAEGQFEKKPMEPIGYLSNLSELAYDEQMLRAGTISKIDTTRYSGCTLWMAMQLNNFVSKKNSKTTP